MQFWCSALKVPWSWAWRPYLGVWVLCAGLLVAYGWALHRRHRTTPPDKDITKRKLAFVGGVFLMWLASDWPVGLLGASYLASVHMVQYMIYTLGRGAVAGDRRAGVDGPAHPRQAPPLPHGAVPRRSRSSPASCSTSS